MQTARPPRSTLAYPPASASRRAASASMSLDMSGIGVGRVGIVGFFGGCGGGIIAGGNGSGMGTGYGVRGTGYGVRGTERGVGCGDRGGGDGGGGDDGGGGGGGGGGDGEGSGSVGGVGGVGGSAGFPWRVGVATATAAVARASTSSASSAVELGGGVAASASAASAGWRRGASARGRIPAAGGAYPALPRGPDTRNRTSNPDSWVLPGRTTIGGEARSPRARPRHPMGSRGKLRPSGQPREGRQKAARGRRPTLLTRGLWRSSCRIREGPQE